jgi:hypothetical protein
MGELRIPVVAAIVSLTIVAPAAVAGSDGHVNFFLGLKSLDGGDWAPVEDQGEFGVVMSFGQDDWPVHVAVDVLASGDESSMFDPLLGDIDVTGATYEVSAGVRKIWSRNALRPYVGGGLALVGAAAELDSNFGDADADDDAVGAWVGGGLFFRLGKRFNIGGDVRWSSAEVDLDFGGGLVTPDLEAGGLHVGLLLGFGW